MSAISEFRKKVRAKFPHVKISIKTVSFADLARDSAKCLTVEGDKGWEELKEINEWAREAGVLPDTNIRAR